MGAVERFGFAARVGRARFEGDAEPGGLERDPGERGVVRQFGGEDEVARVEHVGVVEIAAGRADCGFEGGEVGGERAGAVKRTPAFDQVAGHSAYDIGRSAGAIIERRAGGG